MGKLSKYGSCRLAGLLRRGVRRRRLEFAQQALADRICVHVVQLRRYESGSSQPTLEVIRRMAVALGVSADLLLFAKDERGPDDELKLQFEAVSRLDPEEKKVITRCSTASSYGVRPSAGLGLGEASVRSGSR